MKFFPSRAGPPIYPKGRDTDEAFRDWAKDEIKTAVSRAYDLGKFLFSVSATALAFLLTLVRLFSLDTTNTSLSVALIAFGVSLLSALSGVVPRVWELDENTDIPHEYTKILLGSRVVLVVWLLSWSCGVIATAVLLGAL